MGHPRRANGGRQLSPLAILSILARKAAGETAADLSRAFLLSKSTINRWMDRWGDEAEVVTALKRRAQTDLVQAHQDLMAVADASHQLRQQILAIHKFGSKHYQPQRIAELLAVSAAIEDGVRQLEGNLLKAHAASSKVADV